MLCQGSQDDGNKVNEKYLSDTALPAAAGGLCTLLAKNIG